MKQKILSAVLALSLLFSSHSVSYAWQGDAQPQVNGLAEVIEEAIPESATRDSTVPSPGEIYDAMIALQDQDAYREETPWTNDEPYSDAAGYYYWNGGTLNGVNVAAVGCVAFAFILSDAAFGGLQARIYGAGGFTYEDIKVGDILQVNNDIHTVIVLEVSDAGVVVAEGNYNGQVHWGRTISREEVMNSASHYITRYPEGYVSPDDPAAGDVIGSGVLDGGLVWELTMAGTLTISGSGAMPDFSSAEEQPWNSSSGQIRKVVIGDGVTGIGACAFWNCGVLSAEIPSGVTTIGNSAFRGSSIISVTLPSGVTVIGENAFRECRSLSSISFPQGLETIGQSAFYGCTSLTSIDLPSSVGEVGAAAFFQCTEIKSAAFAAGSKQVKLGDNLFTGCYYLMKVTLPQNIDRIGEGMFQNCLMLAGVEIPQGAESIGASAFASCSGLTTVLIPDSVTTIGIAAFAACPLSDIYFTGTEAQWNSISKIGDTETAVSKATMHYEYSPDPETPTDPEAPTDPETPSDPAAPTDPETPTDPEAPTDPETPSDPAAPTDPEAPSDPAAPTDPEAPTDPAIPSDPETPSDPAQPPVQGTGVPSIDGASGKEGWEAVKEAVADTSGETVRVNMNGAFVVPGDVLDSVKGQNITISFDMGNGIVWSVNGRDVTADSVRDVDLSVQVGTSAVPQDLVNNVAGDRQVTQLSLAHSGDFGYSAVLRINVGADNAGLCAKLFYYNESAGALEFVTSGRIGGDGITELTFTHASNYVIVVDAVPGDDTGDESSSETSSGGSDGTASAGNGGSHAAGVESPKTGESDSGGDGLSDTELSREESGLNFLWAVLIGAFGVAAAGIIICRIRKKENIPYSK